MVKWKKARISPLDIALDRDNPRINVEPTDKESDIIRKLIVHEEVQELARKLVKTGLLPGERVIVVQEKGQWVVLEGNRRICACPQLVPSEFRKSFPKATTAAEIALLEKVDVDVAPDRRTAEPTLTLRHTESGVRKWKPVARMRRVRRLLDEGFSVEQIAEEYNASVGAIRKTIREHRLLQLASSLPGLSAADRMRLEDLDLKTNPYTRFFDLGRVKEYMGLSFDTNGDVSITPPRKEFDAKLKLVVKAFLHDENFDTRTDPHEVLGPDFKKAKKGAAPPSPTAPSKSSRAPVVTSIPSEPTPPPPAAGAPSTAIKPDRFFESLTCRVQDHSLAAVGAEIRKINAETYAISATYLLRTLIELCLRRNIAASSKTITGRADPTLIRPLRPLLAALSA